MPLTLPPSSRSHWPRLLVLDDSTTARVKAARAWAPYRIQAHTVETLNEARARLDETRIHGAIVDYSLRRECGADIVPDLVRHGVRVLVLCTERDTRLIPLKDRDRFGLVCGKGNIPYKLIAALVYEAAKEPRQ